MNTYRRVRDQLADQQRRERAEEARRRLQEVRDELARKNREAEQGRLEREEPRRGQARSAC